MKKEEGFFVRYGDSFYSPAYEHLREARADARKRSPDKKLQIYHGILKRQNDQIIDDSELALVPRIGGYGKDKDIG